MKMFFVFLSFLTLAAEKPKAKTDAAGLSQIIDKLQAKWDEAKTYSARFNQVVSAKRMGTRDETQGIVYVSKPNRLRWVSETDNVIQILNGNTMTFVTENPRRKTTEVDIYSDASKAMDSKVLKFLSGKAQFKSLYKFKLESETPEIAKIKFAAKDDDPDTLVAEVDKKSYLLRSLTTDSPDNRVRIDFSDIRLNVKLDGKLFEYKPKKSDVVRRQK